MAGMLEIAWEFKMTMINMLRDLIDKVDSMQEQMGNVGEDGYSEKNIRKC